MLDWLIQNTKIIDGTNRKAYLGNIGIQSGKLIVSPTDLQAHHIMNGHGLTLCPGFIDSHSHSDLCLNADPSVSFLCKISQGITSEVTGQCGVSLFPVSKEHLSDIRQTVLGSLVNETMKAQISDFSSFEKFLSYADQAPKIINYAFLVGHSTLRAAVMGLENRKATKGELSQMKALLQEAMEHGAKGLSSGLVYIPGAYSDREELIELCKVIAPYHGIYATHMRNEADQVCEAVAESIAVAEAAHVQLVISHHKICGRHNWGASKETLRLIHEANDRGVHVNLDMYPYHATQTTLNNCINPDYFSQPMDELLEQLKTEAFRKEIKSSMQEFPPRYDNPYLNAGGFDGILIISAPDTPKALGKTIGELARLHGEDEFDTFFDLLLTNRMNVNATYFSLNEEEMLGIYQDPYAMVGTDAICRDVPGPAHPRAYGSLVKPLSDFALKRHLLSLEEAVYKETLMTARIWQLQGKGAILDGYDADLVLLDEATLQDTATFENGAQTAAGIRAVFVGGGLVYENGSLTGLCPGKCLLHKPCP